MSNEVGGDLVGNARWLGVPLRDLLDEAGVRRRAPTRSSAESSTASPPASPPTRLDGRDALLAVGMNGEPLPLEHGFPVRMVVPGLYGYVSATKWLTEIEVTRFDDVERLLDPARLVAEGPIKTASRIDMPRGGGRITAGGRRRSPGSRGHQHRGIDRVEVQVDDGEWQHAELAATASARHLAAVVAGWDATPGEHRLRVRATDGDGETQTEQRTAGRPRRRHRLAHHPGHRGLSPPSIGRGPACRDAAFRPNDRSTRRRPTNATLQGSTGPDTNRRG